MDAQRPWDRFLTERDREHLRIGWSKQAPFGLGEHPAVLVIDNTYSFLGPRLPLLEAAPQWPYSCGLEGWEAVDRTVQLLACAREHDVPVIYSRSLPETLLADSAGAHERNRERLVPNHDLAARWNEVVDELAPLPHDMVVDKVGSDMFLGTALHFRLLDLGVDTVVLCGNSTSGCVRATACVAMAHRYRVGVVEECVFDRTQASHAINLFDIDHKYGDVISLREACDYLNRRLE